MKTITTLLLLIVIVGCAQFDLDHVHDHHYHEPAEHIVHKENYTLVADVISAQGCSTAPLRQLDLQIAKELSCLADTPLGRIDAIDNLQVGGGVRSHLQYDAALALKRVAQRVPNLVITSGWRSVAQQHVLKSWQGRCGIGLAATPGRSHHQSGLAIDTGDYRTRFVREALKAEGFTWYCDARNNGRLGGCADPVHFTYATGEDLRDLSVLAFQKLWNRNNPDDEIDEDGVWGPATAMRIDRSPVSGFLQSATCETSTTLNDAPMTNLTCDSPDLPTSYGYESCDESESWRCACSADLGETISQVCRDGVWLNHQRNPWNCDACNDETQEGCSGQMDDDNGSSNAAAQICGYADLSVSESGDACADHEEESWRCACSESIGDVVSQVCRAGRWINYRLSPSDCGRCDGEYSNGCEP